MIDLIRMKHRVDFRRVSLPHIFLLYTRSLTLYLFLFYFILGVKLSARDSTVIIKVFSISQNILLNSAAVDESHHCKRPREKSHHAFLPYYLFSMIRNIFQDKTINVFYSTVSLLV